MVVGDLCLECIEDLHRAKALVTPALGLSETAVHECLTALSEAVANALTHGQRERAPYCRVTIDTRPEWVHITVEDHGNGFDWSGLQPRMPSWEKEHGRGVHLIREMMDSVTIRSTPQGTRVDMAKRTRFAEVTRAGMAGSPPGPRPRCGR